MSWLDVLSSFFWYYKHSKKSTYLNSTIDTALSHLDLGSQAEFTLILTNTFRFEKISLQSAHFLKQYLRSKSGKDPSNHRACNGEYHHYVLCLIPTNSPIRDGVPIHCHLYWLAIQILEQLNSLLSRKNTLNKWCHAIFYFFFICVPG